MFDLTFSVEDAQVVPFAAVPTIAVSMRAANAGSPERVHSILLRTQIQIEATKRRYSPEEQHRLMDLFGEPSRWSQTVRPMLWTHVDTVISSFQESTAFDLHVPCSFDFNVAATKYFGGLMQGDVGLLFLFSGTVFLEAPSGSIQVSPIPWNKEARFRLPVSLWRSMMDEYYPNGAWLRLRRDTFERLAVFKRERGATTWEEVFDFLLPALHHEAVSR